MKSKNHTFLLIILAGVLVVALAQAGNLITGQFGGIGPYQSSYCEQHSKSEEWSVGQVEAQSHSKYGCVKLLLTACQIECKDLTKIAEEILNLMDKCENEPNAMCVHGDGRAMALLKSAYWNPKTEECRGKCNCQAVIDCQHIAFAQTLI